MLKTELSFGIGDWIVMNMNKQKLGHAASGLRVKHKEYYTKCAS